MVLVVSKEYKDQVMNMIKENDHTIQVYEIGKVIPQCFPQVNIINLDNCW
jgi:hydrogenase maturation factor